MKKMSVIGTFCSLFLHNLSTSLTRTNNATNSFQYCLFNFTEPCAIDSVFRWSDDYIYFFAGASYYRYNEISRGINSGYPRRISDYWHGVPNNIDGVFRYANGITYFFKGSVYYRFNDVTRKVDAKYPKKIKSFWKGIPDNIDDVIR